MAEDDTAEFNNALAFLERLNKLEYAIEEALINWDLRRAIGFLESYETEIFFVFKPDEITNINNLKKEILEFMSKYPRMGEVSKNQDGSKFIMNGNITPVVRNKIIELNKALRGIKYRSGMGMPKKGDQKLF